MENLKIIFCNLSMRAAIIFSFDVLKIQTIFLVDRKFNIVFPRFSLP
jgi:hypothetical protein